MGTALLNDTSGNWNLQRFHIAKSAVMSQFCILDFVRGGSQATKRCANNFFKRLGVCRWKEHLSVPGSLRRYLCNDVILAMLLLSMHSCVV